MQQWEDSRLIAAFKLKPDDKVFEVLVNRYQRYAYAIALNYVKDETDATDVVQESFMRMLRSLHTFRGGSRFSTWLYSLVYFTSVDWIRKNRGPVFLQVDNIEEHYDEILHGEPIAGNLDQKIRAEYIEKALKLISEDNAMIIRLFYFMDQSLDEIGIIMNIPGKSAIKVRLFRARAAMKQILNDLLGGHAKESL
ncbi:MAG: polymerase sigma factor, sigma-70 family [Chitinophagaceae bacterium]|nr:polymerase sigma factor, sigma-70 family [Chitinophagaceae bacterium]